MEKANNLAKAYEQFDILKEHLEFSDSEKELEILDEALECLNRYLMEIESKQ
jgi:hypothetical protein